MTIKRRREHPLHVMLDDHEQAIIDKWCKALRLTKRELISRLLAAADVTLLR